MREGHYEFFALTGEHLERFEIVFTNAETLSTDEFNTNNLEVYYSKDNNSLVISNPMLQNLKSLEVYNILGQSILDITDLPNETISNYELGSNINTGVYIINLSTKDTRLSKKILVE